MIKTVNKLRDSGIGIAIKRLGLKYAKTEF